MMDEEYNDRFCFYCQQEFESIPTLITHIEDWHSDTVAYYNIAVPFRKQENDARNTYYRQDERVEE